MSEQEFNDRLNQIGDRYEEAKDILNPYAIRSDELGKDCGRLLEINL